jgi:tubulin-specific chaperone E
LFSFIYYQFGPNKHSWGKPNGLPSLITPLTNHDQMPSCPPRRPVMSSTTAAAFRLGQRVHAAGDPRRLGTVRYLGPVEGHGGVWVGVDWDDGAGGRHDGSLAGRRYFVAVGECSATFARPTALSGGISLPDALRLRYRVQDFTKEEQG